MDPEVAKAWDTAKRLEGTVRQVGKHAGGVLISPSSLVDFTATYKAEGDDGEGKLRTVSQFDKDDVEEAGLVKFDFLGLKTLTIIKHALKNIESNKSLSVDLEAIDFADEKSFNEIFIPAKTSGVFQLESKGMKDLIKKLKPENFKDIIALLALFRPGPMDAGMVDLYCDVKNGIRDLELPHPRLAEVLKDTYGVFLYQSKLCQRRRSWQDTRWARPTSFAVQWVRKNLKRWRSNTQASWKVVRKTGSAEPTPNASLARSRSLQATPLTSRTRQGMPSCRCKPHGLRHTILRSLWRR